MLIVVNLYLRSRLLKMLLLLLNIYLNKFRKNCELLLMYGIILVIRQMILLMLITKFSLHKLL